jgi:hypothetical protein
MGHCRDCVFYDQGEKGCNNALVDVMVSPDCDDGYVVIQIKFEPYFGCIFFKPKEKG